jgi:hypothetical protein
MLCDDGQLLIEVGELALHAGVGRSFGQGLTLVTELVEPRVVTLDDQQRLEDAHSRRLPVGGRL